MSIGSQLSCRNSVSYVTEDDAFQVFIETRCLWLDSADEKSFVNQLLECFKQPDNYLLSKLFHLCSVSNDGSQISFGGDYNQTYGITHPSFKTEVWWHTINATELCSQGCPGRMDYFIHDFLSVDVLFHVPPNVRVG